MKAIIFILFILKTTTICAQTTAYNTTLFSSELKQNNLGLIYKNEKTLDSHESYKSDLNPEVFRLAYLTGFVIFLEHTKEEKKKSNYKRLNKVLQNSGYSIYQITNQENIEIAIPKCFVSQMANIPYLLDGDYTDLYLEYLINWDINNQELKRKIIENNVINDKLNDKASLYEKIEKDILETEKNVKKLELEISDIEGNIIIVEADLISKRETTYASMNVSETLIKTPSLLKSFIDQKVKYEVKDDFFIRAFDNLVKEKKLENIETKSWLDKNSVKTPYLHPDLVAAIDQINNTEKIALQKIGIYPLRITSVARTPYNQAVQIASVPVAAGMFSSGHLCGASVDFGNEKMIIKNYDAFKELMDRHGLYCDPNLAPGKKNQDPKHVYLGKFKGPNSDPSFINDLLSSCLSAYQESMTEERSEQLARNKALNTENKTLANIVEKMDVHLATVQKKLEDLKQEKNKLESKLEEKKKELNVKTSERAIREIERKFAREGKKVSDHEIRDRLGKDGTPRDGYWERHTEFNSRGNGWECRGSFHENSRGEKWGGYECRTTSSDRIGIERLH